MPPSKPFDATTKDLLETAPADWLALLGHPTTERVTLIDADLSTLTAEADKVFRIDESPPWLLHLELQASRDESLARRMLRYNVLLAERHGLPVSSAVVLLRREADAAGLTGTYRDRHRLDGREHRFPYRVVRLWRTPVEAILAGGVGTLPLAPLARVTRRELAGVVSRMRERLSTEAAAQERRKMWTAAYVLMGLRYEQAFTARLLEGVLAMEESVTYQAIISKGKEQGRVEEARELVLALGGKKFGPADESSRIVIESMTDRERLATLLQQILDVDSWAELLAE